MTQPRCMDDSNIALEMALGKLGGGEEAPVEWSESDRDPTILPKLAGSESTVLGYRDELQQALGGPSKEKGEHSPPLEGMPLSLVTDGSELVSRNMCMQSVARHSRAARAYISDSKQSKGKHHRLSLRSHRTKDNSVSREEFVVIVGERLAAVAKDRETMQKIAQEQARQEGGRNFKEIMAMDWYDLPEASKYVKFDMSIPNSLLEPLSLHSDRGTHLMTASSSSYSLLYVPYHSPVAVLHWDERPVTANTDLLAQREVQIDCNRRLQSDTMWTTSTSSSLLSSSDSGVGDSDEWSNKSSLTASWHIQRYLKGQKQLLNQTSKREMDAQAAAITLMNSSPHPKALSLRVQPHSHSSSSSSSSNSSDGGGGSSSSRSSSGRHRREMNSESFACNCPGAYSSDDASSCFSLTSESGLFIPRRYSYSNCSELDDPHQFSRHYRQLSRPCTTRIQHQPKQRAMPIMEQSPTPSSQSCPPSIPAMQERQASSGMLVVCDFDDTCVADTKCPPFAKRFPTTNCITLTEFKKIFARRL